jgi:hypothetical protein
MNNPNYFSENFTISNYNTFYNETNPRLAIAVIHKLWNYVCKDKSIDNINKSMYFDALYQIATYIPYCETARDFVLFDRIVDVTNKYFPYDENSIVCKKLVSIIGGKE